MLAKLKNFMEVRSLGLLPGRTWGVLTAWVQEGSEPSGCCEASLAERCRVEDRGEAASWESDN